MDSSIIIDNNFPLIKDITNSVDNNHNDSNNLIIINNSDNNSNIESDEDIEYKSAAKLSVTIVSSAIFLDALLYSLPIAFYPVLLQDEGYSEAKIGFLFGVKAIVQICCNPIFGFITNK